MKELCKKQFSKQVTDDRTREKTLFKGTVFKINIMMRKVFDNHKMKIKHLT